MHVSMSHDKLLVCDFSPFLSNISTEFSAAFYSESGQRNSRRGHTFQGGGGENRGNHIEKKVNAKEGEEGQRE